ncbi:MAG TPA: efflux RND transporter periplasmic adaptor subunit [Geobacteraceae bacterium]
MSSFSAAVRSVLALVILSLFVTSCSQDGQESAKAVQLPTVAVAKADVQDLSRDLVLTAELRPFQEVEVMAKVAGYVKSIHVDIGDKVRKGELLAVLEIPEMADDLARGTSALKASESEAARARDELHRTQSVHEIAHLSFSRLAEVAAKRPGLIAQQELDDARGKDLAAEAQVAAAQSGREAANDHVQVNRAALSRIRTMLAYARVTAPFDGVVTKRYADTGSMIQAGTASQTQVMPLVRLSDNSTLRIVVPVPESVVPTIHVGKEVEVRVPTLNRSFAGKVSRFTTKLATSTRTMDTEIDMANPGRDLVPGMFADVRLTLDSRKGVLAVPITAVDLAGGNSGQARESGAGQGAAARSGRVMVVTPANRIEVRQVSLGLETSDKMEILSGLKQGELVVIGGRSSLQAGQLVKPRTTVVGGKPS